MTPAADREALYLRLWRTWPEWMPLQSLADELGGTGPGVTTRAHEACKSLYADGRIAWGVGVYRARMGRLA